MCACMYIFKMAIYDMPVHIYSIVHTSDSFQGNRKKLIQTSYGDTNGIGGHCRIWDKMTING